MQKIKLSFKQNNQKFQKIKDVLLSKLSCYPTTTVAFLSKFQIKNTFLWPWCELFDDTREVMYFEHPKMRQFRFRNR